MQKRIDVKSMHFFWSIPIEAFANIYRNFALTVSARKAGEQPTPEMLDFPDVRDGLRGMQFIETIVKAGWNDDAKWVKWVE